MGIVIEDFWRGYQGGVVRNLYGDQKNKDYFQADLNEIVRCVLYIDPFYQEEEKRIVRIRIVRQNGESYSFHRQKNQITFTHVTREAEADTLLYHFELFHTKTNEYFRLTWNPFNLTARIVGYDHYA